MKRLVLAAAAAAALMIVLAGCGEKKNALSSPSSDRQSLSLMLDWFPNADHVGIYEALANGDFAQAGLDVHVQVPSDPSLPLKLVAAGKIDAAISYEPEVMLARNQGLPVVSIAALVQKPLTSIVSLGSKHIKTVQQLRGKRVGDAGIPYQHAYLSTILAHAGIPASSVKEINVGSNLVPAMISGRVDATLGAYWNYEAIQLAQMGKHPNVIRMDQVGVPTYDELVLVVNENFIAKSAGTDEMRRFVHALARGYEAVRSDPSAAVANLVHASSGLSQKLQLASVEATLPDYFPSGNEPWGWQNQSQWNAYGEWMMKQHLVSDPNAIVAASTNELLAGQGVG
jgi:putative hydroxymethylpyrimidine transport system substrate-binding protein